MTRKVLWPGELYSTGNNYRLPIYVMFYILSIVFVASQDSSTLGPNVGTVRLQMIFPF